VTRVCAWCDGPIPARARRAAVCCSVRCRQARHRFLRAAGYAGSVTGHPLRLAFADPPYPSKAYLYRDHPDYRVEVGYAELIGRLAGYDGWALSTSAQALPAVLALCPPWWLPHVAPGRHARQPHTIAEHIRAIRGATGDLCLCPAQYVGSISVSRGRVPSR
jgi:hypothetical protein